MHFNRELKQRRRRRQGRRPLVKYIFIFYQRNSQLSRSSFPSLVLRRTWSFHVVVLQKTIKKCTKIYNARAHLLFSLLNLLFDGVLVAVVVAVCLSSLVSLSTDAWSLGGLSLRPRDNCDSQFKCPFRIERCGTHSVLG